ncbi:hypothetical protein [Pseudomonas aeruginosa]|uniref:hypothetical protein n=1 Tax=Pseudomonas aeruginosa TaxID=287 RepID=UPI00071BCB03|nr:hypothetical protein [Pseudomonas aeruginosa]KSR42143.1 hypothetical protein APB40_12060 [Pseudomonas aeruginosa]OFC13571.1 hypothetical protein AN466_20895 [Pseudomonas aeruginosa]WGV65677.1 hypothetical protein QIU11_24995 [Pseudomonas aeruginosa]
MSALELKVSPLSPVEFFQVLPSLSVEAALKQASSINHSVSDLLEACTERAELMNLAALEFCSRLAGELVDAALDALRKEVCQ